MIFLLSFAALIGWALIPDPIWANISLLAALIFSFWGIIDYG